MTLDNEKKSTIDTYNKSITAHASKFNEIGARVEDIKRAFSYVQVKNPKTVELGCGNGRDAKEIIKHTNNYIGVDLSEEMIDLARKNVPEAKFLLEDMEAFQIPKGTNVIFAFASILHSDKESVREILEESCNSMVEGGVFFISSKFGDYHKEMIDKEGHGPKTYYFYSTEEIENISPKELKIVYKDIQDFRGQKWFSVILQKSLDKRK